MFNLTHRSAFALSPMSSKQLENSSHSCCTVFDRSVVCALFLFWGAMNGPKIGTVLGAISGTVPLCDTGMRYGGRSAGVAISCFSSYSSFSLSSTEMLCTLIPGKNPVSRNVGGYGS